MNVIVKIVVFIFFPSFYWVLVLNVDITKRNNKGGKYMFVSDKWGKGNSFGHDLTQHSPTLNYIKAIYIPIKKSWRVLQITFKPPLSNKPPFLILLPL